jgi:hypothetical protein
VGWCRAPRVFEVLTTAFDLRPSLDEVHIGQTSFSKASFLWEFSGREPLTQVCDAGRQYQKLVEADLLIPENLSTIFQGKDSNPASSLRTVGKISQGKAPQSLSYFHEALNWQTWQTGFLFVFSVQLDGEKPDKITRGACACNDDKVIFENPLNWTTRNFKFPIRRLHRSLG